MAAGAQAGTDEVSISRWWRVVGGMSMNLALGSLYAWSVFVAPLEKEFGWKRADTSQVFTWAVVVFAISFIFAGRLQDKLGPFWVSITGGLLVSLGFFLCAFTSSLTYLIVCFGLLGGIGNGFGYATPIPVMAKWFPDRRGLAVGLAVAGYGGGSAIFGPLANLKLIPTYGWRTTFEILGVNLLRDDDDRGVSAEESARRLQTCRMDSGASLQGLRQPHMNSSRARFWPRRRFTSCGSPTLSAPQRA